MSVASPYFSSAELQETADLIDQLNEVAADRAITLAIEVLDNSDYCLGLIEKDEDGVYRFFLAEPEDAA